MLKRRRNEFEIKIDTYLGKETIKMNETQKKKMIQHFETQISLITNPDLMD